MIPDMSTPTQSRTGLGQCMFFFLLMLCGNGISQSIFYEDSSDAKIQAEQGVVLLAQSTDSTSSSQAPTLQQKPTSPTQKTQATTVAPKVTTEEELKKEEHQRIAGVVPNFNVSYNFKAPPLTPEQKLRLAMHTNLDSVTFVASALTAGYGEIQDQFTGYGWGAEGYAKRFGAAYADNFDGVFWGNAVLPIVLHQDPRYFRLGTGTFKHRFLYSISTSVICKSDSGHWEPNVSNVMGNIISGGISNVYYPKADRGVGLTFENAFTVTAEGTLGALFNEFWPDVSHRLFKKKLKKLDIDYDTSQPSAPQMASKPMSQLILQENSDGSF